MRLSPEALELIHAPDTVDFVTRATDAFFDYVKNSTDVVVGQKLGFEICLLPAVCAEECGRGGGMKIIGVKTVQDVIDRLF